MNDFAPANSEQELYEQLLYHLLGHIRVQDFLAQSVGLTMTDSQVKSVLTKASSAWQGKSPKPPGKGAADTPGVRLYAALLMLPNEVQGVFTDAADRQLDQSHSLALEVWVQVAHMAMGVIDQMRSPAPGSRFFLESLVEYIEVDEQALLKNLAPPASPPA